MSDAAGAGLPVGAQNIALTPGTVTGQLSIDGPGLNFVLSVLAGLSEGRTGPGLAFNTQIAQQGIASGQAFTTAAGEIAFSSTNPPANQLTFSQVSERIGNLLTQSANGSPANSSTSGYVPSQLADGFINNANTVLTPNTNLGGNVGLGGQQASLPAGVQAEALPQQATNQVGTATTPASLNPSSLSQTAAPNGGQPTVNLQAQGPVSQGAVQIATVTNEIAASLVLPYGAAQGLASTSDAERAVSTRHDAIANRRRTPAGEFAEDDEFDGAASFLLPLPEGLFAIDDPEQGTVGVQDRDGNGVLLAIDRVGRIGQVRTRAYDCEERLGIIVLQERLFDRQFNPRGSRTIEQGWPASLPSEMRTGRFRFDGLMPIVGKDGRLRAFADPGMRNQRAGMTVAPIWVLPNEHSLPLIVGLTVILAKRGKAGAECLWHSFDLAGCPLNAGSHGSAIE